MQQPNETSDAQQASAADSPAAAADRRRYDTRGRRDQDQCGRLGGTAEEESGSLGQPTFEVLAGFAGETSVRLSFAHFGHTSGELILSIGSGRAAVVIGGTPSGASPDFDGDGWVDFKDFIAFARAYGQAA